MEIKAYSMSTGGRCNSKKKYHNLKKEEDPKE